MPSFFLMLLMMIFCFLILILLLINFKFYMNLNIKREKSTPFECGFMYMTSPRLPFSLQFFIISLIFLIFDIEISIIIPFIYTMNLTKIYINILIMTYFLTILIVGVMIEWLESSLDWLK